MGPVGVVALRTRQGLPLEQNKYQSNGNIIIHTTSGVAIGLATEIVEGRNALPPPDWRIYYLFELGQSIHVLCPMSMRFELQRLGR